MIFHKFSIILGMFKIFIYKILYPKRIKYKKVHINRSFIFKIKNKSLISIGEKTVIREYFTAIAEKKGRIIIGENCFFNNNCSITSLDNIIIGNDCLFGENVKIYDHNHIFNTFKNVNQEGFATKKVVIGNNVWIGSNVVILPGAEIGDNCVIGANVCVKNKIESNTILKNESGLITKDNIVRRK